MSRTYFVGVILFFATAIAPSASATVIAHFEYSCQREPGCSGGSPTTTQTSFGLRLFNSVWGYQPQIVAFGPFPENYVGESTIPIPSSLKGFFTYGASDEANSLWFSVKDTSGSTGRGVTKASWLAGGSVSGDGSSRDWGYDAGSVNGIDLAENAPLTHIRFQLFNLELADIGSPPLTWRKYHYRFEFISQADPGQEVPVPEPSAIVLFAVGLLGLRCRKRALV